MERENPSQSKPCNEKLMRKLSAHDADDIDKLKQKTGSTVSLKEYESHKNTSPSWIYYMVLLVLCCLSLCTRLYQIEQPPHICWDETHFGKMGSWYIKRTFFFDVHPPLGKMLIGLAGHLTGYDGQFPFAKPGDEYGETKYVGMRVFCAVLGAALVPLSYMTVWLLTNSVLAASFSAMLVLLDTGTCILSRYILLDPILLFFIMGSTYSKLKFLSFKDKEFSFQWIFWLIMTGLFLSASIGVKFVGLFVILWVGMATVDDLWRLLGDKSYSLRDLVVHVLVRATGLILLPFVFYAIYYAIHFKTLSHSGTGDGFFSSAFQSQLEGNKLYNISMPEYMAYGSQITIKQRRTGGAYLHSHWHLYPEEHPPRQQQVTTYSHKDENNYWIIKPPDRGVNTSIEEAELVKSGDLVRLQHVVTARNLHSHREKAPFSKLHYQLSGYGQNGTGDSNDVWIVDVPGYAAGTPIQTARTKFRLIHSSVKCAVYSHEKKLPKWGWEQLEATCNPNIKDPKVLWSIEEVIDPRLPNVSFNVYAPNFWEKFLESHAVMTQGNSGLKPKEGEVTSRPWMWPIDYRGQIFSGKNHKVYLLGNPVIFWICLALTVLFLAFYLVHCVKARRMIKESQEWKEYKTKMFRAGWWLFLGWSLHYFPFWPMTRVLYFHHYFPAFLFSAMLSGVVLDISVNWLCSLLPDISSTVYHTCVCLLLSSVAYSFYLFSPMIYGWSGRAATEAESEMFGLKWMDSWDI